MGFDEDERFAHVANDPKFRRIPKSERKVKIDRRFKSMFTDKKFKVKYTTDKRGRPVNNSSKEDLRRYYDLDEADEESTSSNSSSEEIEEGDDAGKHVRAPKNVEDPDATDELKQAVKSDRKISDGVRKKLKDLSVDYARGEGVLGSESSSDDDDDEEEDEDVSESEGIDHKWGELDADADRTDEVSSRLAICNMDWDRIRAVDLMVLFNSFLPPGGLIKSVAIYPSEYGLQRMREEEIKGPMELVQEEDESEQQEEGSKFHMEKLRQYQLNRLKYYYGILTCDSSGTANKIYTECDGMEYESTATKIDLRFVPDDMTFDSDPKEICEQLPDLGKYKPRFFTTTALQQAKVDLTWDETNPERIELTSKLNKGKIDEISDADLQQYLADSSSSSEDEQDEQKNENSEEDDKENPIEKYKALLSEIEEGERKKQSKDVQMEISWGIDLKEKTEKLVKQKQSLGESENKTPFQRYLDKVKEKRKEKRNNKNKQGENNEDEHEHEDEDIPAGIDMSDPYFAEEFQNAVFKNASSKNKKKKNKHETPQTEDQQRKQAELELLLLNEDGDNRKHFSLKKLQEQESQSLSKSKRKTKRKLRENDETDTRTDDFEINVKDDRFAAIFTSHLYNIDPTDPHYKKTKGMERLVEEKFKRRNREQEGGAKDAKKIKGDSQRDAELSVLVKSVKRKAEAFKKKN